MKLFQWMFLCQNFRDTHYYFLYYFFKKLPEVCFYFDIYGIWLHLKDVFSFLYFSMFVSVLVISNIKIRILQ